MTDNTRLSNARARRVFGAGTLTTTDLAQMHLDRIGALKRSIHALVVVIHDQALAAAQQLDAAFCSRH